MSCNQYFNRIKVIIVVYIFVIINFIIIVVIVPIIVLTDSLFLFLRDTFLPPSI